MIGVREATSSGKLAVQPEGARVPEHDRDDAEEHRARASSSRSATTTSSAIEVPRREDRHRRALAARLRRHGRHPRAEGRRQRHDRRSDARRRRDASRTSSIGDIPFGNVTQGHVELRHREPHRRSAATCAPQKGKSTYEMSTGRLDFNKPANMRLDGQIASKNLDVRDFFSMFHLEDDPRFARDRRHASRRTRACISRSAVRRTSATAASSTWPRRPTRSDLNLLGEKFDEGHADFEYRWVDRLAGIDGAEIDVRSLSLTKVKKEGRARARLGARLGRRSSRRRDARQPGRPGLPARAHGSPRPRGEDRSRARRRASRASAASSAPSTSRPTSTSRRCGSSARRSAARTST